MDSSTFLYDVPPMVVERFCKIMDSGDDRFGWRGLAVRVLPSLLEVRTLERVDAAGRSPTRELLWSWAQQNSRVQDLLQVLQDMGHHRALQLFQGHSQVNSTGQGKPPVITFQEITEGTRDFQPEMRITEGLFSDVYKARTGTKTFAVKLFKQNNKVSWKEQQDIFRKEIEIHKLYRHPNILDLLCSFSEEGRFCLVYPFFPNGLLSNRLHHRGGESPLSWQDRLTIIKGIAKALHYLHTAPSCPVVCGNVSSATILLDDSLQPKLFSFGLIHLHPHLASHSCTITLGTSSNRSLAYLPEEYIRDGKLSLSLDVYSFGMVVMETVTGRKVIEDAPKQTPLRDLLITEVEDSGSVDSCLQFLDAAAGPWPTAVALSLLRLALDCTASRSHSRPCMENVLLTLSKLLPPPSCPPDDEPHSLDDRAPFNAQQSPSPSIPVEHDEHHALPYSSTQTVPCEFSQSQVTYLSDVVDPGDLYSSWPVQCSCPAEAGDVVCEDCRANGFTPN